VKNKTIKIESVPSERRACGHFVGQIKLSAPDGTVEVIDSPCFDDEADADIAVMQMAEQIGKSVQAQLTDAGLPSEIRRMEVHQGGLH